MRGSPLLRFVGLAVLLLAAGLPVWLLTGNRQDPAPISARPASPAAEAPLQLALSSDSPATMSVSYGGGTIWQTSGPLADAEKTLLLPADQPADLVIKAAWEGTPARHAVRLIATRHDEVVLDTTLWSEGTVEDVATIPGSRAR